MKVSRTDAWLSPGFIRQRYSSNSGRLFPSAKYHAKARQMEFG